MEELIQYFKYLEQKDKTMAKGKNYMDKSIKEGTKKDKVADKKGLKKMPKGKK